MSSEGGPVSINKVIRDTLPADVAVSGACAVFCALYGAPSPHTAVDHMC